MVDIDLNNLRQTRTPPVADGQRCCETRARCAGTPRREPKARAEPPAPRPPRLPFPRCGSKRNAAKQAQRGETRKQLARPHRRRHIPRHGLQRLARDLGDVVDLLAGDDQRAARRPARRPGGAAARRARAARRTGAPAGPAPRPAPRRRRRSRPGRRCRCGSRPPAGGRRAARSAEAISSSSSRAAVEQSLALDDVEVGHRGGAHGRVPGVGRAVAEPGAVLPERRRDLGRRRRRRRAAGSRWSRPWRR